MGWRTQYSLVGSGATVCCLFGVVGLGMTHSYIGMIVGALIPAAIAIVLWRLRNSYKDNQ